MNNEEKDINNTLIPPAENATTRPVEDPTKLTEIESLQDGIIRNDTIPETSKDTPGSNGAFPVGAFDASKD
jgi:hypothetical protein